MATSIEIQQQFTKLVEIRNTFIEQQNKLLKEQSALYSQIVEKIEKMGGKNDLGNNVSRWNKSFLDFNKTTEKGTDQLKDSMKDVNDKLENSTSFTEKFLDSFKGLDAKKVGLFGIKTGLGLLGGMLKMTSKGFTALFSLAKMGTMFALHAAKAMTRFAVSVISFPFKLLNGIINLAGSTQASTELAEAIEAVRKEFGYLDRTAGGTILSLSHSLKGNLAQTGLSVMRVLGNTAAVIRYFTEYAHNLGEVLDAVGTNIGEGGAGALVAYNKALGLTAAGQKAIASRSVATGQSINSINQEIANYSIQLSDAFGVTMKAVSRAVGEMMADVSHFGHLAPKELVQISVYARKLGIDVKNLGQVMDKFMNFEDTATAASNLSQAFGLNIDAFKLMQEQDPAKKMEMLRKSFFAAGKSIESMTYQERRLLAQQTGLDDAALQTTFSLKNQAMSYDQIQKKGDAAKKKQLSQAEAMEKLAGAIERLVRSGQFGSGGFFERFLQGFQTGIMWSSSFRQMIRNIRTDLAQTYYAGIRLGKAFVASFPGVKKIFDGIANVFSPRRFRAMLGGAEASLREFFNDLDFGKLMGNLTKTFRNWLGGSSGGGASILEGFKEFGRAVLKGLWSATKFGMQAITTALPNLLRQSFDVLKSINWAKYISDAILAKDRIYQAIFSNENIRNFVNGLKELLTSAWAGLRSINLSQVITTVLTGMFDNIRVGYRFGKQIIEQMLSGAQSSNVGGNLEWLWDQIVSGFTTAMDQLIPAAESALAEIGGLIDRVLDAVSRINWSRAFEKIGEALGRIGGRIFGFLATALTGIIQKLPGWANKLVDILKNVLQGLISGLSRLFVALFTPENGRKFGTLLMAVLNLAFVEVPKFLKRTFIKAWEVLSSPETIAALRNALNAVVGFIGGIVDTILQYVGTAIGNQFPQYRDTILSVFGVVRSFFTVYYQTLRDFFTMMGEGLSTVAGLITRFLQNPVQAITEAWTGLKNFFRETFAFIYDTVSRDLGRVLDYFRQLAGPLMRPFEALMNLVRSNHSHSVNTIVGADMNRTVTAVQGAGEQMTAAMDNSFKQMTAASSEASTKMAEKGPGSGIDTASLSSANSAVSQAKMLAEAMSVVHAQYNSIQEVSDEKLANLGMFLEKVGSMSSRLQEIHSERIVEVASKLVKDVNQVSADLRSIEPISLETSLKRLANNLGLQELKELSIPQRRIHLQITLNVKMDAEDVETVLVDRPDSRIIARE